MDDLCNLLVNVNLDEEDLFQSIDKIKNVLLNLNVDKKELIYNDLIKRNLFEKIINKFQENLDQQEISCLANFIADSCKIISCRTICTKKELLNFLLNSLNKNLYSIQICRAIGNICYENDNATKIVFDLNGIPILLNVLRNCLKLNVDKFKDVDLLKSIILGCLQNVNVNKDYQTVSINNGMIDYFLIILKNYQNENVNVILSCLMLIDSFLEFSSEKIENVKMEILNYLLNLFKIAFKYDFLEILLNVISIFCENDDTKLLVTKNKSFSEILKILNDCNNETKNSILDFLIVILSGDESMDFLYQNGEGYFYKYCIKSIENDNFIDDKIILCLGNFSRNDENCTRIGKTNVQDRLIKILLELDKPDSNINLQFSCLSTLRNLAIPAENKKAFLNNNLIDKLLTLKHLNNPKVLFKYLATLRILTNKQTEISKKLIENENLLLNLKNFGKLEYFGIKFEASRLLAAIIKDYNEVNCLKVIDKDLFNLLIDLMNSEHLIMQNEALVSIAILLHKLDFKLILDSSINYNFIDSFKKLLNLYIEEHEKYIEIFLNLLSILLICCQKYNLKSKILDDENRVLLSKINIKNEELERKLKKIYNI